VNLTNSFIALATPAYSKWEDFAAKLDLVLSKFIPIYQPAYFERVGLRFINVISRKALDLEGVPFRELIQPAYLGLLAEEDVREVELALNNNLLSLYKHMPIPYSTDEDEPLPMAAETPDVQTRMNHNNRQTQSKQ
jgi:uncharacterized protein (TIGR04255 family)